MKKEGKIIPTPLHLEMERSYLEYAMSVIVGRALPDVRDGLKPVHRRILYAMHELGLTPERPFRKCARVVGDVLGKYHPHGDQAVYEAMVRLVQDFSTRYPLLQGHGNFGSVDNDPPAAMRYTEIRLAPIATDTLLDNVNESIVQFTNNFDNSQREPLVLPAKLPILLLNGCSGIAVGMATNIPPHNLGEVVDGLIALIDNPNLSDEDLMTFIPAPDFPTGGVILNTDGITEAYLTGRGVITIRGVATVEQISSDKKRHRDRLAIIVTELPFQVNKAAWIEKVAELVHQGKISDIADVRDESDRTGIRVVLELKKDASPSFVLEQLYKYTPLESNFGIILLALVENRPCQLSLKGLLTEFLRFREETLTKQYQWELQEKREKLHLTQALIKAINNLKKVVDIISNSPDFSTAKIRLEAELKISESQATSILAMPLRRITGAEKQKLEEEYQQLQSRIKELEKLLSDRRELLKALKKELRTLKRKFGDERRTKILKQTTEKPEEISPQIPGGNHTKIPEAAVIKITTEGEIYWQKPETSGQDNTDSIVYQQCYNSETQIVVVFNSGKAYPLAITQIPPYPRKKTITQLVSPSASQNSASPIGYVDLSNTQATDLILLTNTGCLKRLPISHLNGLGNRGLQLIKLKPPDTLDFILPVTDKGEILVATTTARLFRIETNEDTIPPLTKSAQGNQIIKLTNGEKIIACKSINNAQNFLLISALGYCKIVPVAAVKKYHPASVGFPVFKFRHRSDYLIQVFPLVKSISLAIKTDKNNRYIIPAGKFNADFSREKPLLKLESFEKIIFASPHPL
ncbi:MAG: DNA topoisomerase 4 subunit A [Geminocystis sp.]|nr:DNA topoisomerase 4 subunit A [Geminocystis sp.]HIK37007.1 DNA topoisomerase 4 subunit A [Geminocystis sp. M7585_C2015_104]MCS7148079.1 DNA topoisomerase 4 subunit A [Geminocystis sp.]MCX8077823.1 DNA topoisomerase 4 subunit A [Geminocystis sp.]MDW8116431.1 DNA topoisomerase (ATP-hydrolyzing) [Geminocystis sp.]